MAFLKSLIFALLFATSLKTIGQVPAVYALNAKEFSKEYALYRAKQFVMENVLQGNEGVTKFQIDPLAASSSGELTSLVYLCPEEKKEGLVLGFFGDYVNEAGVNFKGFAFQNLPKIKALELLDKIEKHIDDNSKYLNKDPDNNNIFFEYYNMTILIYQASNSKRLRIFWGKFDSEWDMTAFKRTKKRLLNKLD